MGPERGEHAGVASRNRAAPTDGSLPRMRRRPVPRVTIPPLAACLVVSLATFSCTGATSSSFPGKPDVQKAQAEWCSSLAKQSGGGGSWEHTAACKAAVPTASAAYLRGMTKCFTTRLEQAGDQAPDHSQIVVDCNDEVVVGLPADDGSGNEVIAARCERMLKCEKVPVAECKTAVEKLESSQRAMFTTTYNAAALHEISECLASTGCTDDEEKARDACYKPAADKLLWFPG